MKKDPYMVPQEAPIIVLDSESYVCMSNNGKYTKNNRNISRRVHFLRNGDKCKLHKIGWFEGGLQLVDIAYKNVRYNDLIPRIKYIMVRLDN